jgi:NADPH:quinone reductase-like Zn-dependent oxidoreductase
MTSKAVVFNEFGSADVLRVQEVEVPAPGPGQVRIAVRTAGVNPLDHKIREGSMQQVFPTPLPHVPGVEGAGVVESVGEGVTWPAVGDAVFGPTVTGAYAELALAAADDLGRKPESLGWERAAAVPVAAETSYRALELLAVRPGETLLVHGAAGGVGSVAVQFAIARGLTVIGTAGDANHAHLRALGVVPVRYGDGLIERVRAVAPEGVDAAFDLSGQGDALAASVELTGGKERVVTVANPSVAAEFGVAFSSGGPGQNLWAPAFQEALSLIAAGTLELRVHRAYPLEQAADAQRASEAGHLTGKIVLTL